MVRLLRSLERRSLSTDSEMHEMEDCTDKLEHPSGRTNFAFCCPHCGTRLAANATAVSADAMVAELIVPPSAGSMFIDPHAHMISRTTDDYEAMARAGVVAVIEPSFWLGQPRTNVGSYLDYLSTILGFEKFRAGQFGIRQ
jgi:hypothetical protein